MKDIKEQIEKVQTKSFGNDLELRCETNKYGYDTLVLYFNNCRLCPLNSLSHFEKNYILNRFNNVYIDIEKRVYEGEQYEVIVVREKNGYENESIVLKFTYDTKVMLLAILHAREML